MTSQAKKKNKPLILDNYNIIFVIFLLNLFHWAAGEAILETLWAL